MSSDVIFVSSADLEPEPDCTCEQMKKCCLATFGVCCCLTATDSDEILHLCVNLALTGSIKPQNGSLRSLNKPQLILASLLRGFGNAGLSRTH